MGKCPVCDEQTGGLQCQNCGFDGSRDYEQHPTVSRIPGHSAATSRLRWNYLNKMEPEPKPESPKEEVPEPKAEQVKGEPEKTKSENSKKKRKPVNDWMLIVAIMMALLLVAGIIKSIVDRVSPSDSAVDSTGQQSAQVPDWPASMQPAATTVPQAAQNRIEKIAMVTDGGTVSDKSYNQICWEAVTAWAQTNKVSNYTYYIPYEKSNDGRMDAVAQTIAEGADTIVMPGYLFGATLTVVMNMYPDVNFIAVDVAAGDLTVDYVTFYDPAPNVACLSFSEEQAGYLAGYAAVKEGYTKLGFQGAMPVPAIIRYGYGFVQGANAAAVEMNRAIQIKYAYSNYYYGTSQITSQMESWYRSGTQVVFACGGSIYTSVVDAANRCGGKVIGMDVDQSYVDDCILTSAEKNLGRATKYALASLNQGKWSSCGGRFTELDLSYGLFLGLPETESSWRFTTFTKSEYEAVRGAIAAGEVQVSDNTGQHPTVAETTIVTYYPY